MYKKRKPSGVSIAIRSTLDSIENGQPFIEKVEPSEYIIKVANTLEEREAAYHLAYQLYLEKGFIKKNDSERFIQRYDADSETVILIVTDKSKNIIGSVTVVFEGSSKLPSQNLYRDEINQLKNAQEKIVEISRLVVNTNLKNSKNILVLLFNYLTIYAFQVKKYTCLVIEVNPRHRTYYKELLGFEEIGGEKPCPMVQNALAILLYLPITKFNAEINRCQNTIASFKKERTLYPYYLKPNQECLVAHYLKNQVKKMTDEEKYYFGFLDATKSVISRI